MPTCIYILYNHSTLDLQLVVHSMEPDDTPSSMLQVIINALKYFKRTVKLFGTVTFPFPTIFHCT